jgi:pimeloyl-ACP methyl ester carboxylesterase
MTVAVLVACDRSGNELEEREAMTTNVSSIRGPAGTLHVDDGGEGGVPVVFVHAYTGTASHWSAQLEHLRPDRRAVAFDLRGHGESDAPRDNDYAIASLARDIDAVLDSLHLTRVVLVGHSLGGAAAIEYAGIHPERVAGLMLVTTTGRLPDEQTKQITAALDSNYAQVMQQIWSRLLANATPQVRTRVARERERLSEEESRSIIRATFDFDPLPALGRYQGPTMNVTTGDDDPTDLHHLVAGLRHRAIEGTSHWPQMDEPDEFNRVLDEFLRGI